MLSGCGRPWASIMRVRDEAEAGLDSFVRSHDGPLEDGSERRLPFIAFVDIVRLGFTTWQENRS